MAKEIATWDPPKPSPARPTGWLLGENIRVVRDPDYHVRFSHRIWDPKLLIRQHIIFYLTKA